jgi:hypothetical protein
MKYRSKDELVKAAEAFIEASQRVKAAQQVLKHQREAIIPAFNKFCRADEDGNRTIEFGPTKIMLVPSRKVDEAALRSRLGADTHRFTERHLTVALHTIQHKLGAEKAKEIAEDVLAVLNQHLESEPTLLKNAVKTHRVLDVDSALASLPKEVQKEVKVEVSQTLRPYPENQGFKAKVKAALKWLKGEKPKTK